MRVVRSRIEYFSQEHDRTLLVIKEDSSIVGIDFMQGDADYDFSESNGVPSILLVYNASQAYLSGDDEFERVNQAIWIWFELSNDGFRRTNND